MRIQKRVKILKNNSSTAVLPPAMLLDLEATLSNNSHRLHLLPNKLTPPEKLSEVWDKYFKQLKFDTPYLTLIQQVKTLQNKYQLKIFILSAVPEKFRQVVHHWLITHDISYDKLLLRPDDDFRDNAIVKQTMLQQAVYPNYRPIIAIDDMTNILDIYASAGIKTYRAKQGRLYRYSNAKI